MSSRSLAISLRLHSEALTLRANTGRFALRMGRSAFRSGVGLCLLFACKRSRAIEQTTRRENIKDTIGVLALAVGLVACGSNDEGGHDVPAITDGLDGSRRLSDLTPAELDLFCDNGRANYLPLSESSRELFCRIDGFFDNSDASNPEGACKEAVATCLAEAEPNEPEGDCEIPEKCVVTVNEYAACLDEFSQLFRRGLDVVPSCSAAGDDAAALAFNEASLRLFEMPLNACQVLDEKCPEIGLGEVLDGGGLGGGSTE